MMKKSRLPSRRIQGCHHQVHQIVVVVLGAEQWHPPAPVARTQEGQQTTPTGGEKTPLQHAVQEVRPKIR